MMQKFVLLICMISYGSAISPSLRKFAHGVGKMSNSDELNSLSDEKTQSTDQYFTQKLDHLNPSDARVWKQRYWKSEEFHKPGGPIFLLINGESEGEPVTSQGGQWISYAKDLGATCFSLEHRFYGNSQPLKDTSTENLAYLSTEQAVEDIAEFVKGMNALNKLPSGTKWFVFGGSYAGALAVWARMKHPELIHGAVSSSGPLLSKVDFPEYYRSIQETLAAYDERCPKTIQSASTTIADLAQTEEGRLSLTERLKLCSELQNNPDDINNLFNTLALYIGIIVQYNKDNGNSPLKSITVDTICDILVKESAAPIDSFIEVSNLILTTSGFDCHGVIYQDNVDDLKLIDYESAAANDRQWLYQNCAVIGFFETSSDANDLFSINLTIDYFTKLCEDVFGKKFDRKYTEDAVIRNNQDFGGLHINIDKTVFVQGSVDPWHTVGITQTEPDKLYDVIFIEGAAHCSDMYASGKDDSGQLIAAREKILNLLRSWAASP